MATGKILRFDEIRGYGFIAPDAGGEDVFLHANALLAEKHQYHPGVPVEFDVIEGERGLKATAVRVLRNRPSPSSSTPGTPVTATAAPTVSVTKPAPMPPPAAQAPLPQPPSHPPAQPLPVHAGANGTNGSNGSVATAPPMATPATVAAATGVHPATIAPQRSVNGTERQAGQPGPTPQAASTRTAPQTQPTAQAQVSPDALGSELVELCLESVPSMTGEQITQLRRAVVTLARRHGWLNE
ncbi:cold shock domain-containing protein [Kineosporia sp. J2-2]|uniref:Cold shock domain-containing protein n=1 Tax=Kineosporia corallincola TaxID=2835133 RepID=A0ABS5TDE7_9ACTN|nr:cold shock domain-containing protein [Kineosporia corallincola]MBT0768103.1 cold shock domain-containing protein [Kineosporia corallincola]